MKVLIADDNRENLYMLEALLQGSGYEVTSAADGVEALDIALHDGFDMIISDILMPRMDGFQLCREVKKNERLKEIPFIFYTATYTDLKDQELALSLGAEKFIMKPEEPDVFIEIIKAVLKEHELGTLAARKTTIEGETVYLKRYNERLIKKLEDKMLELEKANKILERSEERYRDLIENANDGVVVIEPTGCLSFVNPKFCDMTGYSTEEANKLHFSKLTHPEDLPIVMEKFETILRTGEFPKNYEFRALTKAGEVIYAELNANPVEKEGKIVGVEAIVRDVTRRKRAEQEKEELQAQLLHAQKMEAIGTLAGGVAHDFNNLLTSIQGYTELAMMELDPNDPVYLNLKEVRRASVRAANLTRQLLLFSRRQPMEMIPLSLNQTIEDMMKMVRRLIGEDISVITQLEEQLWTTSADPGNIEQVIMNLVVNARDAMPEGGSIAIKTENVRLCEEDCKVIQGARPGNFVCLSIADTGSGMNKEIIERIFEPFFSTKSPGKGTGLGLSVVYGIIQQHEGWITVHSKPGLGSTFNIYLPSVSTEPEKMKEESISLAKFQGRGERILLVEDEDYVRELSARTLKENGYIPFPARSAKEALEIFKREKGDFSLIFSDVVLPDKNGLQLVEKLLSAKASIHIILTSGYSDDRSLWEAIRKRQFRFLQKPYTLSQMLQTIREVLKSAKEEANKKG